MTINCVLKNSRLNSLADPGGNFRQDRASVEEVENHDRHDHRHRRHCHHEGQVDSWQKICLQWTINGKGKIVFFCNFPTLDVEKGARANFCASAAQKFPHSQTYAQTAIWKYACVCSWFVCLRFVFFLMCYCYCYCYCRPIKGMDSLVSGILSAMASMNTEKARITWDIFCKISINFCLQISI